MKLLRAEIENFGRISHKTYDLSAVGQPVELLEANGHGKSTLAHFIKVMLFGFDAPSGRSKESAEHAAYVPWQGGQYGGRLVFSHGGKTYAVVGVMGQRNEDDRFVLYDESTQLESHDLTIPVGECIFRIGQEAFLNSVYWSQNMAEARVTTDMHGRVGLQGVDPTDLQNYQKVDDNLKKAAAAIDGQGKSTTCKILSEKITACDAELKKRPGLEEALGALETDIAGRRAELADERQALETLRKKRSEATAYAKRRAEAQAYREKTEALEERRQAMAVWSEKYPKGMPTQEEVTQANAWMDELENAQEARRTIAFDEEKKTRLGALAPQFMVRVPEEEELDFWEQAAQEIMELQEKNHHPLSQDEQNEMTLGLLDEKAGVTVEAIEQWQGVVSRWNKKQEELSQREIRIETQRSVLQASANEPKKKPMHPLVWVGAALALVGLGLFLVQWMLGLVLLLVGVGAAVVGLVLRGKMTMENPAAEKLAQLEQELAELAREREEERAKLEDVHAGLNAAGLDPEADDQLGEALHDAKRRMEQLAKWKVVSEEFVSHHYEEQIQSRWQELQADMKDFYVAELTEPKVVPGLVGQLRSRRTNYLLLMEASKNDANFREKEQTLTAQLQAWLERFGLAEPGIRKETVAEVGGDVIKYQAADREYRQAEKALEDFCATVDVEQVKAFVPVETETEGDPEEMDRRLNEKEQLCKQKERDVEQQEALYQETLEGLDQLETLAANRQEYAEEREAARAQAGRIKMVRQYLATAKEQFTNRYTGPIMQAFETYVHAVMPEMDGHFVMDANLQLHVREGIENHEISALSAGYQDITYLCLRAALVDVMFREEKPVLLLDDPFVNLDDERMELAVKLLKKLAEEYQVLYFTCHSSRRISE